MRVLGLSASGLRVKPLDETNGKAWYGGEEVQVEFEDGASAPNAELRGARLELRADGLDFPVLELVAPTPEARDALWLHATAACSTGSPLGADALPRQPARGVTSETARLKRLQFAEQMTGTRLESMYETSLLAHRLAKNVEGLIGGIEIPVGLAGPLLIRGVHARGLFLAPFATTEGSLVASATRGAVALSRAGGVNVRVLHQRLARAPAFILESVEQAERFSRWIERSVPELEEQVGMVSNRARLVDVQPYILGRTVHVCLEYETADAAGQNMTTATTWQACKWVLQAIEKLNLKLVHYQIEGNMNGDKKHNMRSMLLGRGFRVAADCYIPASLLREVLKVEPQALKRAYDVTLRGSIQAGAAGMSINASNAVAAIFAATGQDIACVQESGVSILSIDLEPDGGVYASIVLPSLVAGTVGGGTHIARQRQMLELLGCEGDGGARKLAEIITSYCLGLDLSTLSAIAGDQFASAHERLGRNRPVQPIRESDLDVAFFARSARALAQSDDAVVEQAQSLRDREAPPSGIASELAARKFNKTVGLFPYRLVYSAAGGTEAHDVMVKLKPLGEEILLATRNLATSCSPALSDAYARYGECTGFTDAEARELAIYASEDARIKRHVPRILDLYQETRREAYVIVMEHLRDAHLLDAVDVPEAWGRSEITAALEGIAEIHSVWAGRAAELASQPWIGTPPTAERTAQAAPLWMALAEFGATEFPGWFSAEDLAWRREAIETIAEWWPILETQPQTLVHNDFNPRNLCFRKGDGALSLCVYDWELATMHAPQRDVAEFIAFVFSDELRSAQALRSAVEVHREAFELHSGLKTDGESWWAGFCCAVWDFAIHRLGLYVMAHSARDYSFVARLFENVRELIGLCRFDPPDRSAAAPGTVSPRRARRASAGV